MTKKPTGTKTWSVFKIRRRSDGLFSSGGSHPNFTKKGKLWRRRGDLTSHLSLISGYRSQRDIYDDCEVVEYQLVETAVSSRPVGEHLQEIRDRKAAKRREATARRLEERERQKARSLLAKYGPNP